MPGPRWRLSQLLILVAACGLAAAAYRWFWEPRPNPNARPYLAAYLTLLVPATLGAFHAQARWRRACQGFALFGWCNLIVTARDIFVLATKYDAERVVQGSQMGVVFGLIAALLTTLLLELTSERDRPA